MPRVNLIQLRGGTAAAWTSANPVLALREPGFETDTRKVKYGDGVTAWNSLSYAAGEVPTLEDVLTLDNDAHGLQIKNIFDGSDPQDAVTKSQLDAAALGIVSSWKAPVKVATAVAGTLASDFENGDTVDGVVLVTGDRILIKNQASAIENGIYIVAASGAPARSSDANTAAELEGVAVMVQQGTAGLNTTWIQTTDGITLGVSNIVWSQMGTAVSDASETVKGIIEIADQTEANAGTDDTKAITALKMSTALGDEADYALILAYRNLFNY